jgi:putative transposase
MKFVFIAKHRSIWPVAWLCDALGVSRSGFHAWLRPRHQDPIRDTFRLPSLVARQLPASPFRVFARRVEHTLDMPV